MHYLLQSIRERFKKIRPSENTLDEHIHAAARWIAVAQDATPDDGVAHSYDLRGGEWLASYPETTGYIIPTLYDYAKVYDKPEFAERARRMARWESDVQLPDGGVRAGRIDADVVVPTVFNTGQVLFGWARAYQETGDESFALSLRRAADWLLEAQDADGAWRRFSSPFASQSINPYNTRTAFGLTQAAHALGDNRYIDAAVRNVEWALGTSDANGWLPGNCLSSSDTALTHTIAYAMRGILEVGAAADRGDFIAKAKDMAKKVAATQRSDGAFPGEVSPLWRGATRWTCVTGNAQLALNFFRVAKLTNDDSLIESAIRANAFNQSIQDLDSKQPAIRGALKGSHPINGEYMEYRYPNWAAKFFIDALILERDWKSRS